MLDVIINWQTVGTQLMIATFIIIVITMNWVSLLLCKVT